MSPQEGSQRRDRETQGERKGGDVRLGGAGRLGGLCDPGAPACSFPETSVLSPVFVGPQEPPDRFTTSCFIGYQEKRAEIGTVLSYRLGFLFFL